jgi:chitodextrinase
VALDQAGNPSAGSDSATITLPDVEGPSVPTGLTAAATGAHSVEIDWQPATDNVAVDHYDVYRNGGFVGDAPSGTSYTDTGLTDATQYTYAVVAVDAAGNPSDPSDTAGATTPDATPPTAPGTVRVKAVSATQTTLTWTKSTDNVGVTGYVVYRNGAPVASVPPTTVYQDMGVTGSTVYKYAVVALDAAGNASTTSATAQLRTPGPDTTAPTSPTNLTAALTATKAVLLRWGASTDNVGVAGYRIFRDGQPIASLAASARSFTDSTAPQAQAHTYTVAAYDAVPNVSAMSNQVTITVPDTIPPSTPTNLTLTPGSKSITLSWTASTDNVAVKCYQVFRNGVAIANVSTGTTFTNLRLITGTVYSYYVVAVDTSNKRSAPSTTQSAAAG